MGMASIQTLSDADRRCVARWAVACAEHVIHLFEADGAAEAEIRDAIVRTHAYSRGEGRAAEEIGKRLIAGRAAKAATTPSGSAAARSVAQAAAVAHMGAHALGAAAHAVKAVSLAEGPERAQGEIRWQLAQLSDSEGDALATLPALGSDRSGPLGGGLLSRGILGESIRAIQADPTSRDGGASRG